MSNANSKALATLPPTDVRDLGTPEEMAPKLMPRFRDDLKTLEQALALAQVAIAYGLDPFMKEIVPYEGEPYITIAGMVRIAGRISDYDGFDDEPATDAERKALAVPEDEILWKAFVYRKDRSRPVKGYGRAGGQGERNALVSGRNKRNQVFINPGLQARKRAIHNALRMAFPTQLPGELVQPASNAQLRHLHALDDELGIGREERHHELREVFGAEASNELTSGQASAYIDGRLVDLGTGEVLDEDDGGVTATPGKPATQPQMNKLFAEANERGWSKDQVRGRAAEINPAVSDEGLGALDRAELSQLIQAVIEEQPWVDPRQQRMEIDESADREFRNSSPDEATNGELGPDQIDNWNDFWRYWRQRGLNSLDDIAEVVGAQDGASLMSHTPQRLTSMLVDAESGRS